MKRALILFFLVLSSLGWAEKKRRHVNEQGLPPPESGSVLDEPGGKTLKGKNPAVPEDHSTIRPTVTGKPIPPLRGQQSSPAFLKGDIVLSGRNCDRKPSLENLFRMPRPRALQGDDAGGALFLLDDVLTRVKGPEKVPETVAKGVTLFETSPDGGSLLVVSGAEITLGAAAPVKAPGPIGSAKWDAAGTDAYFTYEESGSLTLAKLTAKDRKTTILGKLNGPHFLSDVSPDGRALALTALRPSGLSEALLWTLASGRTTRVGKGRTKDAKFTANSQGLFFLQEVRDQLQVHFAPVKRPQKARALTNGKWGVESVVLSPTRLSVGYRINEDGYSRVAGLLVDGGGAQRKLLNAPKLPKGVVEEVAFARKKEEGAHFFVATSSQSPPEVWQGSEGLGTRWTNFSGDRVDPACLTPETLIRYPAFDRKEIPAFLYAATNPNEPAPYVILIEGLPETQFRPRFHPMVQYLVERGFGVLAPNVRGRDGYGRSFLTADDERRRPEASRDVVAASRWLVEKKLSTPDRLSLVAEGYGGWLALRALFEDRGAFAGATLTVPWLEFGPPLEALTTLWRPIGEAELGRSTDGALMKSLSAVPALESLKQSGVPLEASSESGIGRARNILTFLEGLEKRRGSR